VHRFVLISVLLAGTAARADEVETVRLKNGGYLRGTVVEFVPGERVVIRTLVGTTREVAWAEIEQAPGDRSSAGAAAAARVVAPAPAAVAPTSVAASAAPLEPAAATVDSAAVNGAPATAVAVDAATAGEPPAGIAVPVAPTVPPGPPPALTSPTPLAAGERLEGAAQPTAEGAVTATAAAAVAVQWPSIGRKTGDVKLSTLRPTSGTFPPLAAAGAGVAGGAALATKVGAARSASSTAGSERSAPSGSDMPPPPTKVAAVLSRPAIEMRPPPVAAEPPPDRSGASDWDLSAKPAGLALGAGASHTLDSDNVRRAWLERGGGLFSMGLNAGGSYMYMPKFGWGGAGVSAGVRAGWVFMNPPNYAENRTRLSAFRFGFGADVSAFSLTMYSKTIGLTGRYTSIDSTTMSQSSVALPTYIGFIVGGGSFDSSSTWSGWTFGLNYAPSYVQTFSSSDSSSGSSGGSATSSGTFNPIGFDVDIQSGSLESTLGNVARKAHFRINFFFLPPINDLPLIASASIGAVWY